VSKPFETDLGWHLVKIDERRKEQPPSIDELRGPILKHLTTMQIGEVLKQLRTEAKIEKQTSPRNSPLEVDPFTLAPDAPEPAAAPAVAPPPSFDASARAPVSESREPAPQPAAPATKPPVAPAQPPATPPVTPPTGGPVSESRQSPGQ
jgi:peptidyl-prolyl cis-trans isomerase C